jgi:hypothetical protein
MLASPYRGTHLEPQRPATRKLFKTLGAQRRELNFGSRMSYIRFNSRLYAYGSLNVPTVQV